MNKSKLIQKEKKRASERKKHQNSFIARNYWLWVIIAFVAYPLSIVFSAITEGGNIYLKMQEALGDGWAAIACTTILVIIIESLKFVLGKGAVDDIQAGVFSDGGSHLALFAVKVVGFIFIMGYSIIQSLEGAPSMNEYFRAGKQVAELELIDIDSIEAKYEAKIQKEEADKVAANDMTWHGKVIEDGRTLIKTAKANIKDYETQKQKEIDEAKSENKQRKADWKAKTVENGEWAKSYAGLGEAICIFCLIFIGIYDDGIDGESEEENIPKSNPTLPQQPVFTIEQMAQLFAQTNQSQIPPNQSKFIGNNSSRNKIGFDIPETGFDPSQTKKENTQNSSNQSVPEQPGSLSEQGGTVFPGTKEQSVPGQTEVVFIEDKKVFKHINSRGVIKYYTQKQCESFVNKYTGRLKKAKSARKPNDKVIQNQNKWLAYWKSAVAQLQEVQA